MRRRLRGSGRSRRFAPASGSVLMIVAIALAALGLGGYASDGARAGSARDQAVRATVAGKGSVEGGKRAARRRPSASCRSTRPARAGRKGKHRGRTAASARASRCRRVRGARKARAASARRDRSAPRSASSCRTPSESGRGGQPSQGGGSRGGQSGGGSGGSGGQSGGDRQTTSATPVGTGSCPGVRPGAVVRSDVGQCTLAFLFRGGDGRDYIATAGHCILGEGPFASDAGERTWAPGQGPAARDASGRRVGEFAYAILQDPYDFSLIRLDPGVTASPQVCHFGGPIGIYTTRANSPQLLHWFGQGLLLGQTVPARSAVAPSTADPDHVFAVGAALPGDSGSGVITPNGAAVGILVTVGVHAGSVGSAGVDAGTIGITRLAPQLARAERALGTSLTLRTAPLL